jgi:small subunit ribosomal protein S6
MSSEYKRFRDYELMVILHPELSEEDVATEADRVQEYLSSADATVTHVNRDAPWGRRRLAYPIRHGGRDLRDGIYVLYYFNAETGRIEDMEREIKLNDRIIRYLLTQQIAPIAEPEAPESEEGDETPAEGAATPEAPAEAADTSAAPTAEAETAPEETAATADAEADAEVTDTIAEGSEGEPAES